MHAEILTSTFRICIPKAVRERLRLKAGREFVFVTKGETIRLVPSRVIASLRGILRGANTADVRDGTERDTSRALLCWKARSPLDFRFREDSD